MMMQPYTRELSRQYPGLFVILLDQSSSMSEPVMGSAKNENKAQVVTRHVNTIIQEMIDRAGTEESAPGIRKKYAYLSVLGYDDDVAPLLSTVETPVDIPTLARNPRGKIQEQQPVRDAAGNIVTYRTESKNFWIEPRIGRNTNMTLAFERAMDVVDRWLKQPPDLISPDMGYQRPRKDCFPPVVINVTDGYYNNGGNPRKTVETLSRMSTNSGSVLVFNCHFTTGKMMTPRIFPKHVNEVRGIDPHGYAEEMFYMSSVIPEPLRQRAIRTMRRPIEVGARCVAYNADLDALIRFLRWGTIGMPATGVG